MVCKKINNNVKKSATLMGLVMTLIVFIGIFTIMFSWLSINSEQSGISVDSSYNESYNRVIEQRGKLNETVVDIQEKLDAVEEADNVIQVAWNGMKFLGTAIFASKDLVTVSVGSYSAASNIASDSGVPPSILILITIGIVAFVVFLVLSNLKGEPKMIN